MKAFVAFVAITFFLVSISPTQCAKRNEGEKQKNSDMKEDTVKAMDREEIDEQYLLEAVQQCNETYRIDISYFTALNESGSFPDETDKTPKCNIRCFLISTGVSSEEGDFDSERAALVYAGMRGGTHTEYINMANTCAKDRKEQCKCERSYQFIKCFMEMAIAKYQKSLL